ncbi:TlyA family RNA methyltransferase [Aureimonas mangrovi]|uniref:TlyA family RNA methyltransferase n=1 Tax=Aureimonas mangrovi TaxID=2758041 RepID=UPI00163DB996|nr:TlyA family RNA methyltransferase [Aureimonas mangrovi]
MNAASRQRLDEFLAERGIFPSRARARDAILRGHVRVDGEPARKPSQSVAVDAAITVDDPVGDYVSRAALKLIAGLDAFGFDPAGREALDIGASTGGFTQVLLGRGAPHVVAVDVGHGQMHPLIAGDPRVTLREGLNAREMVRDDLDARAITMVVADVSFISLRLALPPALDLAEPGALGLFLVKPQFEAGREAIGKGGLLRDPGSAETVAEGVRDWFDTVPGWRSIGLVPSPIDGGDGNREFLMGARKT